MMYVPEFVALYEIIPYIEYLPLDNDTIRIAVKDYLEGGMKKDAIIKKYGKIEDWEVIEINTEVNQNRLEKLIEGGASLFRQWRNSKIPGAGEEVDDLSQRFR